MYDIYGDASTVILSDRYEILPMLEIKEQGWHRVHLYLKVLGWLSDLNALLTRKVPMPVYVAFE